MPVPTIPDSQRLAGELGRRRLREQER